MCLPEPSIDSSHISNTDASTWPPTKLLCLVYWLNKSNKTGMFRKLSALLHFPEGKVHKTVYDPSEISYLLLISS